MPLQAPLPSAVSGVPSLAPSSPSPLRGGQWAAGVGRLVGGWRRAALFSLKPAGAGWMTG
ncbi:hypothetical protein E2C01_067461 [Portunus trituberculatus]|uniref:Uncharacterized protein n=1 Tax=Portunus trituberculatus TaxID=210409 RepID=A0A5B7HSP2_PORTR|nr:hypothetical protein [Portunus trituberculatus]